MYRSPKGKPVSPSAAVRRNAAVFTIVFHDDNFMVCVTAKHQRQPSVADIESEVSKDEQDIMGHCIGRLTATKPCFWQKIEPILCRKTSGLKASGARNFLEPHLI